jgi:hypothetical protein
VIEAPKPGQVLSDYIIETSKRLEEKEGLITVLQAENKRLRMARSAGAYVFPFLLGAMTGAVLLVSLR